MSRVQPKRLRFSAWVFIESLMLAYPACADPANPLDVVINEIAWMGTEADYRDEWIELYNNTDRDIDLTGWTLEAADGTPSITLTGTIPAKGFFLLERTDDKTVSDIQADQIYGNDGPAWALKDEGETLFLKDPAGSLIDSANSDGGAWPAGSKASRSSMERIDPLAPDSDANWATNDGVHRNGLDANAHPINGTPRARNSVTNKPPIADAGPHQTVNIGDLVQLDGSGSSDPDGDPLSYSWSFIARPLGSAATLSDPHIADPTFLADVAGDYSLQLVVDDGRGGRDLDQVTITANAPPHASFTFAPKHPLAEEFIEFTDRSTDEDGRVVSWHWDFGDGASSSLQNPIHAYAQGGQYTVTLTVEDDDGARDTAAKQIEVINCAGCINLAPQPLKEEGGIFWLCLPANLVAATLKIFDVDGAELVTIPLDPTADRYPEVGRWIPKDAQGRLLGTGLYLYLVEMVRADGTVTYSPVHKMVIMR